MNKLKKKMFYGVILFSVFIVYLLLNVWAIKKIEIDTSADSIINTAANLDLDVGLLKTKLDSKIRVSNPTFIPVFVNNINYDLRYGDRIIGEGKTGFIFIMPKSYDDTSADFKLNHVETGIAAAEGIINLFQKEKKSLKFDIYASFGPMDIPLN